MFQVEAVVIINLQVDFPEQEPERDPEVASSPLRRLVLELLVAAKEPDLDE